MRRAKIENRGHLGMLATLVLSIVLSTGCATGDKNMQTLQDTLDAYKALIRWGEFNAAMQFLHPDHMPKPRDVELIMKRFEQIQVNGYVVKSQSPSGDVNTFLQTAEISFANRHNMVVRTIDDHQVWRWEPESERWMLISGLPNITRR